MPTREEITYFGSGPAALDTSVLEQSAAALLNFQDTGLGLAEHSHRSDHANKIVDEAQADLASYLDIPRDDYDILFMQAGGNGQFAAVVYNLVGAWVLRRSKAIAASKAAAETDDAVVEALKEELAAGKLKTDYLITGRWSEKAMKEAQMLIGDEHVNVATDAKKANGGRYGVIPPESEWKLSPDAALVYLCDNETVDGVEFPGFPASLAPQAGKEGPIVVGDMSSNILTRKIPVRNYSVIFFGAQKNLGVTGVTVAIVKKSLVAQPPAKLMRRLGLPVAPSMFSYDAMVKNNSLYNTLSIFDLNVAGLVLKKLLATFPDKVAGQEAVADKKAAMIYGAIEKFPDVYRVVPAPASRSRMNICFSVVKNGSVEEAEKKFLADAKAKGMIGLKGHRAVGGVRAANYNSITVEGAQKLVDFIEEFARE